MSSEKERKTFYVPLCGFCFNLDCDVRLKPAESCCGTRKCIPYCDLRIAVCILATIQVVAGVAFGSTALATFLVAIYRLSTQKTEHRGSLNENASQDGLALALVIFHTARWLFALTTGCMGLFIGLSIRGIKTYSSRVLRLSRAYLVCCIIILLSDLNPLSYGKASWASTVTAALSGAGFAPLPLDIYGVYIAWSMQKKLHDQKDGVFEGKPVLRSQQKPAELLHTEHVAAVHLVPLQQCGQGGPAPCWGWGSQWTGPVENGAVPQEGGLAAAPAAPPAVALGVEMMAPRQAEMTAALEPDAGASRQLPSLEPRLSEGGNSYVSTTLSMMSGGVIKRDSSLGSISIDLQAAVATAAASEAEPGTGPRRIDTAHTTAHSVATSTIGQNEGRGELLAGLTRRFIPRLPGLRLPTWQLLGGTSPSASGPQERSAPPRMVTSPLPGLHPPPMTVSMQPSTHSGGHYHAKLWDQIRGPESDTMSRLSSETRMRPHPHFGLQPTLGAMSVDATASQEGAHQGALHAGMPAPEDAGEGAHSAPDQTLLPTPPWAVSGAEAPDQAGQAVDGRSSVDSGSHTIRPDQSANDMIHNPWGAAGAQHTRWAQTSSVGPASAISLLGPSSVLAAPPPSNLLLSLGSVPRVAGSVARPDTDVSGPYITDVASTRAGSREDLTADGAAVLGTFADVFPASAMPAALPAAGERGYRFSLKLGTPASPFVTQPEASADVRSSASTPYRRADRRSSTPTSLTRGRHVPGLGVIRSASLRMMAGARAPHRSRRAAKRAAGSRSQSDDEESEESEERQRNTDTAAPSAHHLGLSFPIPRVASQRSLNEGSHPHIHRRTLQPHPQLRIKRHHGGAGAQRQGSPQTTRAAHTTQGLSHVLARMQTEDMGGSLLARIEGAADTASARSGAVWRASAADGSATSRPATNATASPPRAGDEDVHVNGQGLHMPTAERRRQSFAVALAQPSSAAPTPTLAVSTPVHARSHSPGTPPAVPSAAAASLPHGSNLTRSTFPRSHLSLDRTQAGHHPQTYLQREAAAVSTSGSVGTTGGVDSAPPTALVGEGRLTAGMEGPRALWRTSRNSLVSGANSAHMEPTTGDGMETVGPNLMQGASLKPGWRVGVLKFSGSGTTPGSDAMHRGSLDGGSPPPSAFTLGAPTQPAARRSTPACPTAFYSPAHAAAASMTGGVSGDGSGSSSLSGVKVGGLAAPYRPGVLPTIASGMPQDEADASAMPVVGRSTQPAWADRDKRTWAAQPADSNTPGALHATQLAFTREPGGTEQVSGSWGALHSAAAAGRSLLSTAASSALQQASLIGSFLPYGRTQGSNNSEPNSARQDLPRAIGVKPLMDEKQGAATRHDTHNEGAATAVIGSAAQGFRPMTSPVLKPATAPTRPSSEIQPASLQAVPTSPPGPRLYMPKQQGGSNMQVTIQPGRQRQAASLPVLPKDTNLKGKDRKLWSAKEWGGTQ